MGKRWHIRVHDEAKISLLERQAGVSSVVAQLLVARGVTDAKAARTFLDAKLNDLLDPAELPGVVEAADVIDAAVKAAKRIVIYGDYDADGMTATAILYRCLKLLGADVGYHAPNRMTDGYGLNNDALTKLAAHGAKLVITVDCGITSIEEAAHAKELGLELIITDHHQFGPALPDAAAIVHPRLPGRPYPFGELCGAAVAFKLAWALCQKASGSDRVSDRLRGFLLLAVGLAALGTVADVVPLVSENRILVRHGLFMLRDKPPPGIAALMRITGIDKKPALSSEDIGFTLAPRLNAAGRLGQAQLGVELMTTDSEERAQALAEYLHNLNDNRVSLERSIYLAAKKQAQEKFDPQADAALVLHHADWHPGVIGIVAGRLAEKYHRPVVMIAGESLGGRLAVGSARTAGGLNLYDALVSCADHLASYGGHAAAAGLKIKPSSVDAFRDAFREFAAREIDEQDRVAELHIDAESPLSQLNLGAIRQIEQLAPFGAANTRPLLCATGVQLAGPPKQMGGGNRHLTLRLKQHGAAIRAVGFGQGDSLEEIAALEDRLLDVAYRPVINDWQGRQSVEIHLVDWKVSADVAADVTTADA